MLTLATRYNKSGTKSYCIGGVIAISFGCCATMHNQRSLCTVVKKVKYIYIYIYILKKYYFIVLKVVIVVYCSRYIILLCWMLNKTTDVRCFVKWGNKIDKITFYSVKLLNF